MLAAKTLKTFYFFRSITAKSSLLLAFVPDKNPFSPPLKL